MTSDSEDDFQTVGHAKRIPHTPRSKSAPTRKIDPYLSPARRLTPASRSRLERDHRLAIREGSPSPLSRKMKKEKHLTSPSTRSSTGSRSSMMSLSSSSSANTTPNKSQPQINSAKTDSNKTQPWSDAENVLLWKAVVKYGDGNVNWDEIKKIVNKASTTTRSKSAVSQHWSKLRKDMETHLDPTNSAAHIDATDEDSQTRGRTSLTSSRSDVSSSPSSTRNLRSRHSSSTVKRE